MYDPTIGRWFSEDPIWPEDDVNPYVYVGNNPLMNTDPTGMYAVPNAIPVLSLVSDTEREKRLIREGRVIDEEYGDLKLGGRPLISLLPIDSFGIITYASNVIPRVTRQLGGQLVPVDEAHGIFIRVRTLDETKTVRFIQFHRLRASYTLKTAGGKLETKDYVGVVKSEQHGDHEVGPNASWSVDTLEKGSVFPLMRRGIKGDQTYTIDYPSIQVALLEQVHKELVKDKKLDVISIEARMEASTYILDNFYPVARIDWQSAAQWDRARGVELDQQSQLNTVKTTDATPQWNVGPNVKDHVAALKSFFGPLRKNYPAFMQTMIDDWIEHFEHKAKAKPF